MLLLHDEICLRACPWMFVSVNFKFNQNKFNNQFLYFLIYLRYYGISSIYILYIFICFCFVFVGTSQFVSFFFVRGVIVMRSLYGVRRNLRWCNLNRMLWVFSTKPVRFSLVCRLYSWRTLCIRSDRQTFSRCWTVYTGIVARVIFNLIFPLCCDVCISGGFSGKCTHQWMCLAAIVV